MDQYLPIVVLLVLGFLFAALSFVGSSLLAPRKRPTTAKIAPYECGIVPDHDAPQRFPVRFYLVAMIFISLPFTVRTVQPVMSELGLDVEEAAAKVTELGGAIVQKPFDVMESGRMSICKDPGDAMFSLWQAKAHQGVGVFGDLNSVCWAELATWDTAKARDFYTALFGWSTKSSAGMDTYIEYSVGGKPSGGLLPMNEQWGQMPSHWAIYFLVADCDAAVAKATELGGAARMGPFDAPGVGRIAAMGDPQGAAFYLITLKPAA